MGLFGEVTDNLLKTVDNRNARLGLASVVLATLLVLVPVALTSEFTCCSSGFKFSMPDPYRFAYVIVYFIGVFAIWFILYLMSSKDATDVYSEVRNLLKGGWIVSYKAAQSEVPAILMQDVGRTTCQIIVTASKKLRIKFFDSEEGGIVRPDDEHIVSDVAVRYGDDSRYVMFYYGKFARTLIPEVARLIAPASEGEDTSHINVEYFARVTFAPDDGTVKEMSGDWYDLNGNASRLMSIIAAARQKKDAFQPIRLRDAPVSRENFSAKIGFITFRTAR